MPSSNSGEIAVTKSSKKILVVDDDAGLREILTLKIRTLGHSPLQAENGEDALKIVSKGGVDLVVSDVQMPVCDGVAMLQQIRRLHGCLPPVVLTSGYTDFPVWQILDWGADAFLGKPFPLQTLESLLPQLLAGPDEKWLPRADAGISDAVLTLELDSSGATKLATGVEFGRGGMFVGIVRPDLARGKTVTFHLRMPQVTGHTEVAGVGIVRWARASRMAGLAPGVGIEFISLSPESKQFIQENTARLGLVALIPQGPTAIASKLAVVN